jgi:hypothetical protein
LWATPDLPVIAGSQECGSAWNSHDYNNQAGFPQRDGPRLAITRPVAFVYSYKAVSSQRWFAVLPRISLTPQPKCRDSEARMQAAFAAAP